LKKSSCLVAVAMLFSLVIPLVGFAQSPALNVMATTTILADAARVVGGDLVAVDSLLPADADTHAYEPTLNDAARVAQADLLIVVGAGYEGFLGEMLESAGTEIPVVVASNGVEIISLGAHGDHGDDAEESHGDVEILGVLGDGLECEAHSDEDHADTSDDRPGEDADATEEAGHSSECDPHVWMNPLNVITWANNIAEAYAEADPANADTYRANASEYAARLEAVDQEIQELVAELPEENRILVTNHEFMGYFAAHYGFEIAAVITEGGSTGSEIDPQSLAELIAVIRAEAVPAIFAERSASDQLAAAVAQEAGVSVITSLYSEALSAADGDAPTYLDLIVFNAQTIVSALQ